MFAYTFVSGTISWLLISLFLAAEIMIYLEVSAGHVIFLNLRRRLLANNIKCKPVDKMYSFRWLLDMHLLRWFESSVVIIFYILTPNILAYNYYKYFYGEINACLSDFIAINMYLVFFVSFFFCFFSIKNLFV